MRHACGINRTKWSQCPWQTFGWGAEQETCLWYVAYRLLRECRLCVFASARTLHQRGSAVPGTSGQHRGRHSLRGGRSGRQLSSAPQLWQGDQREAKDMAFLSGEKTKENPLLCLWIRKPWSEQSGEKPWGVSDGMLPRGAARTC